MLGCELPEALDPAWSAQCTIQLKGGLENWGANANFKLSLLYGHSNQVTREVSGVAMCAQFGYLADALFNVEIQSL